MKKTILEVYALAVCFAAIVCSVIVLGIAIFDVIQIMKPEFTMNSHEYNRHQSNNAFWERSGACDNKDKEKQRPNEEELTKRRLASFQQTIKTEQRAALQSITIATIILIIDIILFLIHWKIAQRAREANSTT